MGGGRGGVVQYGMVYHLYSMIGIMWCGVVRCVVWSNEVWELESRDAVFRPCDDIRCYSVRRAVMCCNVM